MYICMSMFSSPDSSFISVLQRCMYMYKLG